MNEQEKDKLFGEIGVAMKFITQSDVAEALKKQKVDEAIGARKPIGAYFLGLGKLTKEQIGSIINAQEKFIAKQGEPQSTTTSGTQANAKAPGEDSNSVWLVINPLVFIYNCYALTFNYLYAFDANGVWAQIGICLVINIAILLTYPGMIRAKFPNMVETTAWGGIGALLVVGCAWGYYSGNPYTSGIKQYYNTFYTKTFDSTTSVLRGIDEEIKKGDPALIKYMRYEFNPKIEENINTAGKIEVPEPMSDDHEEFVKDLKQLKAIGEDLIKGLEAQNLISVKATGEGLRETIQKLQANLQKIRKTAKDNGLVITVK